MHTLDFLKDCVNIKIRETLDKKRAWVYQKFDTSNKLHLKIGYPKT